MPSARPETNVPPEAGDSVGVRSPPGGRPPDRFSAIVEQSDDAILSKDADGIITTWNPGAARIYGYSPEEAIGQPISILIPAHRRGEEKSILDRVFAGERLDHYETERVRKDGTQVDVSLTISPIENEKGEVVLASVIARDVSARRRSLQLASRLQSLTTALSREITPERAVEVLLEHAVAALDADAGAVGLLTPSGTEIELAGSVGYAFEGDRDWSRFPLDADLPMSQSVRNGEAVWSTSGEDLRRRFSAIDGSPIRYSALAVVPLSVGDLPFGAVSLSFVAPREFDPEEQAFLLAIAQQAAYTLDRARLFAEQRELNERMAFLAEASELLAGSLDPDTALSRLAGLAVGRVADWCGIELLTEEGELRNVAVAHADPEQVRFAQELRERYPVDPEAKTGVPNVIRTGQPELYPEVTDELLVEGAEDEEHLRLMRDLGLLSVMVVPLTARGRTLGAVTFVSSDSGRHYGEDDLELAQDLARRAALAIDNAILYRREHEAAVILQRALLPQSLPELEGVEFAALYEPAAEGMEVGGDWYEVVVRDDGTVAATIGDVAGRGIRAAAVMGRIRPALRAFVLDGYGPAEAVERVHRLVKESDRPEMTTVFQLQFDPQSAAAEYVRAGHPPALLRLPGGEVTELSGGGTPPLGLFEDFEGRSHSVEVPPGSLLLLYTDGLIERRDEDLEAGLARLKDLLRRAPAGAGECLQWLSAEVSADEIPDDVAMLAMATAG